MSNLLDFVAAHAVREAFDWFQAKARERAQRAMLKAMRLHFMFGIPIQRACNMVEAQVLREVLRKDSGT